MTSIGGVGPASHCLPSGKNDIIWNCPPYHSHTARLHTGPWSPRLNATRARTNDCQGRLEVVRPFPVIFLLYSAWFMSHVFVCIRTCVCSVMSGSVVQCSYELTDGFMLAPAQATRQGIMMVFCSVVLPAWSSITQSSVIIYYTYYCSITIQVCTYTFYYYVIILQCYIIAN